MAEQYQSSPSDSPGNFFPQDYYLQKINLVLSNGSTIELKNLLIEFSYHEDIYSFVSSGYVSILDAQSFIELLQLTGNEFLELSFSKVKDAPNDITKIFRVYKLGNRKPTGNQNAEGYTLYFCSEEMMLSEQTKISKSYIGAKISDIVYDVLTNKLKITSSLNIQETDGMYDFVIPKMKPLEAISWVSTYAKSVENNTTADMLFFETKDGFNFRSLQSLYKDDVYATYKYEAKNISKDIQNNQEKFIQILDYEFVKTYDSLHEVNSGTLANKLISIDPLTRSYYTTTFDYKQTALEKLNPGEPTNILKNRLGNYQNQEYEGVLKVATSNKGQINNAYISEKQDGFAKDIDIETYLPQRTAALSLASYTVAKLSIPGDPGITAGRTINFNLLSLKPSNNKKELNKFYSGKYLVTAVRHIIQSNRYVTVLEIAKESTTKSYQDVNNSDPNIVEAVQS
jgi:hypothetical protein